MSSAGMQTAGAAGDVLRAVAHELRQPLSTIESIAYYLSLVLPRDGGKVQEQLLRLQQLVEQSNWILTSALQLADAAPASPETFDLGKLVTETASWRPAPEVPARLELAADLPLIHLDPGLGRALVENLLMLFRQVSTAAHPATLRTSAAQGPGAALEFATAAPGYGSESALGAGAALSLASARRIVEAHGGSLELNVDPADGIQLRVVLP